MNRFQPTFTNTPGNRWLKQVIDDLRKVLKLTRRDSLRLEGRLKQSLEEHRRILAAIRERDAASAEALMHAHLLSGRAALAKMQAARIDPAVAAG